MQTVSDLPAVNSSASLLPREFWLVNESQAAQSVIARLLEVRALEMCAYTDAYLDHGARLRVIAHKLQARTTRRERAWNKVFNGGQRD